MKFLKRTMLGMCSVALLQVLSLSTASAQQFVDVNIKQVWSGAYNDGPRAAVRVFTNNNTFVTGCERSDAFVITSGPLDQDIAQNIYFDQQFSMLLAAQHSDTTVSVFISGCTNDGRFPRATRVTTVTE